MRSTPRILLCVGLIGIYLAWPTAAVSQAEPSPVRVEWSVGKAPEVGWTVGDHIPLYLTASSPADLKVTLPRLPARWGPFEVLTQKPAGSRENADGTRTFVREATVTLWAPGNFETPPFIVYYLDAEGESYEVQVPPISISVASVLKDGETEKLDLKPQIWLPGPTVWPWLLGGLLVALAGSLTGWVVLQRLLARRVAATWPSAVIDERPPHDIAYAELERITALDLPSRGEFKKHYSLVADCLRN